MERKAMDKAKEWYECIKVEQFEKMFEFLELKFDKDSLGRFCKDYNKKARLQDRPEMTINMYYVNHLLKHNEKSSDELPEGQEPREFFLDRQALIQKGSNEDLKILWHCGAIVHRSIFSSIDELEKRELPNCINELNQYFCGESE